MADALANALGSGWLIALIVALIPAALAFGRWIAGKWREPYLSEQQKSAELMAEIKELTNELSDKTHLLTRAEMEKMFYAKRAEDCERELENWRLGKYRSAQ